jgi:hypothetical protein
MRAFTTSAEDDDRRPGPGVDQLHREQLGRATEQQR